MPWWVPGLLGLGAVAVLLGPLLLILPALIAHQTGSVAPIAPMMAVEPVANPELTIVDQPNGRRKELTVKDEAGRVVEDGTGIGYVWLYAEFWVTNECDRESARLMKAHIALLH